MLETLKQISILYVEDEPETQENVAEYLNHYFANVYLASNGEQALDSYHAHNPDVLILDINLPLLDGLQVAEKIRQKDQVTRIIMLTAHTEKEKLLKATGLKLTKYLVKPVSPKIFKETLLLLAEELANNSTQFVNLCERYRWDRQTEILFLEGVAIELSEKEHRLLKVFIKHKGKSVSYNAIMEGVWDASFKRDISIDSIKNQVSMLRKKLPECSIRSVYGEGYVLN